LMSQYLAGIHANFTVTIHEAGCYSCGVAEFWLYANGSLLAHNYCAASYSSATSSVLAGYQTANINGKYLLDLWWPGSNNMTMGSFAIWERPDGSFGFQTYVNPTQQAPPKDCPYTIPTNFGDVCANLYPGDSQSTYSLFNQFISWVQTNSSAMSALSDSLKHIKDTSYNVPYIAQYENNTYTVMVIREFLKTYTVNLAFNALMPASLGAVFANAVLPSEIQAPPVNTTSVPPVSFIASYGG